KLRFYAELAAGEDGASFEEKGGVQKDRVSDAMETWVRDAVDPNGADPWMLDLLRVGQLAVIVGDALFIHGGLYDDALGAVPGEEGPRDSMHSWAAALNAWKVLAMVMKVSQVLPHVWVMDEAVPQSLLDHVDQAFATDSRSTTTKEEYHGRPLTSRSIEFDMDETARPFFEMIAHGWGLSLAEPFDKFMVSDICGAEQSPHVDHINLDDLDGRNWSFLDLGLQSSELRNPRKVVPTVTVVVYFNSVGGICFPNAPEEVSTIAAQRGRVVMFENYLEDYQRPSHNPAASHYGLYFQDKPKRILVMGILANQTPQFSLGPEPRALTRSLVYCAGTEADPLRHENPSYDGYYTPQELRERAPDRNAEIARGWAAAKPVEKQPTGQGKPDAVVEETVAPKSSSCWLCGR
ncbi:unnamed protein product, partial [Symbiodinium sp. KB8]